MRLPVCALLALPVATLLTLAPLSTAPAQSVSPAPRPAAGMVRVRITTTLGDIVADIDSARAPGTATNFLRYVDSAAYQGGRFHRTVTPDNQPRDSVRIEVIQGGPNPQRIGARWPAIPLERTRDTGLRHRDGTLSMARGGPDSATSDFFICVGDQPSLDFGGLRNRDGQGFAAFGQVVQGMDIVRAIQRQPANAQTLTPAVSITYIRRVPPA
ncbi:MAG: peptidylprolyl isomerase [Gemmatimonadetes bacterium]|nr:peptidylprolyl isomerase [Gemmatimonadota bacterium]